MFFCNRSYLSLVYPRKFCASHSFVRLVYGAKLHSSRGSFFSVLQVPYIGEDVAHMHPHWDKWQPWRLRIIEAQHALDMPFEPCLLMEDYKEGNLVVTQHEGRWHVSGVFDLMQCHFGDGEADLSRQIGEYLNEEPQLAIAFFDAYRKSKPLRPGFASRFSIYMLLDRAILWAFFQGKGWRWWPEQWTFRDWASQYISPPIIFDHL